MAAILSAAEVNDIRPYAPDLCASHEQLRAERDAAVAALEAARRKVATGRALEACEREFGDGETYPVVYCGEYYQADEWAMDELAKAVDATPDA